MACAPRSGTDEDSLTQSGRRKSAHSAIRNRAGMKTNSRLESKATRISAADATLSGGAQSRPRSAMAAPECARSAEQIARLREPAGRRNDITRRAPSHAVRALLAGRKMNRLISPDISRACRTQSESHSIPLLRNVFRSYHGWNVVLLQTKLASERFNSRVLRSPNKDEIGLPPNQQVPSVTARFTRFH